MKNLNRKRITLNKKFIFYSLVIIFLCFLSLTIYLKKDNTKKILKSTIQSFSKNYGYLYKSHYVEGNKRVEKSYIEKKINKYLETSIFLLPLEDINNSLMENNWIKKINLKTNYKDTLIINIEEYSPLGIYNFNDKFFYFDEHGKIIDEYVLDVNIDNLFIIFRGLSSNLEAKSLIDVLNLIDFEKNIKIKYAEFINNRRWNIFLDNNVKLMLSEEDLEKSLLNFVKLKNTISKKEFNNIKIFDLRNLTKTIVDFND